jgi:hypothetical protein
LEDFTSKCLTQYSPEYNFFRIPRQLLPLSALDVVFHVFFGFPEADRYAFVGSPDCAASDRPQKPFTPSVLIIIF